MFKHKNIEPKYVKQAKQILNDYLTGTVKPRKTNNNKYIVLDVGREYRLVNRGSKWELWNHQKYNKHIDK